MFILGIDGASYDLIQKYISENKLPNFKKIQNLRSLKSTIPPHTAPGWATAFTGVGPGKHGIYQFWDTQSANYEGRLMGSNDFAKEPVWHLLNKYGIKTGVINVPMTHPPQKLDGYMISWPLSNTLRYCEPPELLIGIARNKGYFASDYSTMYDGDMNYIHSAISITQKRAKTFEYLIANTEWDLLINVFSEVDRVSHFYWQYMDKTSPEYNGDVDKKYQTAIEDIYMEVDKALGTIIKQLPDEAFLMILSDHGFGRGDLNYYIQTFLQNEGLLHIKPVFTAEENEASYSTEISEKNWFEVIREGKKYTVDWARTAAYMSAPGSYGININLKGRQSEGIIDEQDYEEYRDILIEKIANITHPATRRRLFPKVLRREEVYFGDQVKFAPDLIIIPADYGIMLHHSLNPGVLIDFPEQKGMHRLEGVIGIHGKEYELTKKINEAQLEDITPTILAFFGVPIPEDMEGEALCRYLHNHVREPLIKKDIKKQTSAVNYSEEEVGEAKEGLRALGYL